MASTILRTTRNVSGLLRQTTSFFPLSNSGPVGTAVVDAAHQQSRGYADMAFTFASPAMVYYKAANVKQIDVPSFSGSFGILPNHVPLLAVLRPGVITVHEAEGANKKYFVSSGSITINDDSTVQILAEEACAVEQLDAQAVREGAAKAAQDLSSASTEVAKAEAAIAIECYEALQKAIEHP